MKKNMKRLSVMCASLFLLGVIFNSCEEAEKALETIDALSDVLGEDGDASALFGWIGSDEENLDEIEDDIDLSSFNSSSLPSSVDLTNKFPPIGNQGAYGTCVAWSLGYNLKTFLEGVDQGYTSSQLASSSNQFSPKDLFWSVPSEYKGDDCNGTGFEYAFDVMVSRGIAKMSTVPYSELGDCSNSPQSSWTSDANNYKLDSYREVDIDINTIKGYLADGRPVAIGARLGDNFMQWNTDDVINNDTYLNPGMQHAYHAMVLGGYDDDMGSSGAFRVVNSWATSWGDDGYIWVDYDFFVSEFCFAAFVAKNIKSNPDDDGDGEVDNDDLKSGYDLVAWNLVDEDYYNEEDPSNDYDRLITYSVYNSGEEDILATQDWNILYVYYNAYDAEDYGILVFDYYTDDYGDNDRHYDLIELTDPNAFGTTNWWNNIDVASGQNVVEALLGEGNENFEFSYNIPATLNGYYYFVLIADGFDVIAEYDETNNYLFFGEDDGDPVPITNGVIDDSGIAKKKSAKTKPGLHAASPNPTLKKGINQNTYSPAEISNMITHHLRSGELREKAIRFDTQRKSASNIRKTK